MVVHGERRNGVEGTRRWLEPTYGPGLGLDAMSDYTTPIVVTVLLTVVFTAATVWQFLQPQDDDFGDISSRNKR